MTNIIYYSTKYCYLCSTIKLQHFKSIWLLLVCLALAVPHFFNAGWVLWYELNKQYYANELCVKKEVKNNDCAGCCALNKQFLKSQTDTKAQFGQFNLQWLNNDFCQWQTWYTIPTAQLSLLNKPITFVQSLYKLQYLAVIFRPPRTV